MYGTTFFAKFKVPERTVIRKRSLKGLFVFVTIAAFFSVGIVGRYKENEVESETKSKELSDGRAPVGSSTNHFSQLNLTVTGVLEARRSLLLSHCLSKAKSQSADCENEKKCDSNIFPPLRHLHYIQNLPEDLVFCVPLKTGSSSLMNFMHKNVDAGDFNTWYNETRVPNNNSRVEEMLTRGGTNRVLVIRHPFHRLVSAFHYLFRDSVSLKPIYIEQVATSWLAERIISIVRPQSKDPLVSFPEFVDYILDTDGRFTALKKEEVAKWYWGDSPVGISDHFQPMSTFCSPCRLLPQVILELESLDKEFPYVLEWSGLARVYGNNFQKLPRINSAKVGSSKEVVDKLMGELTKSQIQGLLEFYKDDFIIGGYKYIHSVGEELY